MYTIFPYFETYFIMLTQSKKLRQKYPPLKGRKSSLCRFMPWLLIFFHYFQRHRAYSTGQRRTSLRLGKKIFHSEKVIEWKFWDTAMCWPVAKTSWLEKQAWVNRYIVVLIHLLPYYSLPLFFLLAHANPMVGPNQVLWINCNVKQLAFITPVVCQVLCSVLAH